MYEPDKLIKLSSVVLKMADVIDRHGENDDDSFASECGMGYLALSSTLREGVKAIVDAKMAYSEAVSRKQYAEMSEQEARAFLRDVFGDEEVDSLTDENKKKLREFVAKL